MKTYTAVIAGKGAVYGLPVADTLYHLASLGLEIVHVDGDIYRVVDPATGKRIGLVYEDVQS